MVRGLTGCSLVAFSLFAAPASARLADAHGAPASASRSGDASTLRWVRDGVAAPAGLTAEAAARHHLARLHTADRSLRPGLRDARLLFVHDTGRGGVIVGLRQTAGGVDIHPGDLKVLMDRSHRLIAVSGAPYKTLTARSSFTAAARTAAAATALRALYDLDLTAHLGPSKEPARAGFTYLDLAVPAPVDLLLRRPVRVKPIYFPDGAALRPAHLVEVQARLDNGRTADAHAFIVGLDGTILHRKNLVAHESFTYRVYADDEGRPLDGPLEDYNPHPQGEPVDGPTNPGFPVLVEMEGFNTNPDGVPDPWLPSGAKETVGNNIDAYVDWNNPSGLGGGEFRGKINSLNTFDYVYDTELEPLENQTQSMAAITSIFYTTNWLHDWWYDSGFTEAAGNAQADNYGRGGAQNDVLLAEAQDAAYEGARNNANMSTPQDGESPTMQMYLWTPLSQNTSLFADPPNKNFPVGQAQFGPGTYDIQAPLVLVDDGTDNPTDGCEPPTNDVAGKIVLIDRGECTFESKVKLVEAEGALGVVIPDILDNDPDGYPPGPDPDTDDPGIPTQGLSKADGAVLKQALMNGPVTAIMKGETTVERDGTLDNGIVAHEWGHYLHHRLSTCGIAQCGAQSEGWGDFMALMLTLREGDPLGGTYAAGSYGSFDKTGYFALRRAAYTTNMEKNATTFRHIEDGVPLPGAPYFQDNGFPNSEVHNAGEIWTTMLWEAYIALHEAHQGDLSFAEVRRRMGDYVVAGLMMAPHDPTYTEQRDGILAAASAADEADFLTIAEAFARRGIGTCAVSPDKLDVTFTGVVEDFEVRANGVVAAADLDVSGDSCDDDGILDAGESATIRVTVRNNGVLPMSGAALVASSTSDSLVFADDGELVIPDLAPQQAVAVELAVSLAEDAPGLEDALVTLTLATPDGCETSSQLSITSRLNGDIALAASATDDVDAPVSTWTVAGTMEGIWSREPADGGGSLWHGLDFGSVTDTWIASPALDVSADEPLVVSLRHAYDFEFNSNTHWDGGLIELSSDGGATWTDASAFVPDIPYDGPINNPVNPIHTRPVFGGASPGFPDLTTLELDFGDAFAGQSIRLRFRIGTDGFVGGPGWLIDDIAFSGVTNTPFALWVEDSDCATGEPTSSTGDSDTSSVPTTGDEPSGGENPVPTDNETPLDDEPTCNCTSSTSPSAAVPLLALLMLPRRRRAKARRQAE